MNMNEHDDDIDDHRAKTIDQRIRQSFAFAQDVVENPSILEEIPDGSTLAFLDTETAGSHVRLTASRRANIDAKWTARATSGSHRDSGFVETGETAEAALNALAARFHSFWQGDQAIEALRFLAELLPQAPGDPYRWKWVVVVMHDALHGFMGLALRGSHGAQLLIPEHEQQTYRRWAEERRLGRPIGPSENLQVDSFLNLYKKIQDPKRMRHYGHSRAFTPTDSQTEAIEQLDWYWNELTFYSDTTLALTVSWFPTMILECLSIVEWLLEESNTITLFPEKEERAREMIQRVRDAATPHVDLFSSEDPT
jgi:hypothetical protein